MTMKTDGSTKAPSTERATGRRPRTKPTASVVVPETGAVAQALRVELSRVPDELAQSTLAESALALARDIDNPDTSATARSMCSRSLLDALNRIRELMPATEETDAIDELASRRPGRIVGGTAS